MSKTLVLENFLEFKKTSVHKIDKIKDIERYLNLFLNSSNKPLKDFKEEELIRFINSLDFSIRTINDIKSYVKTFIRWYYEDYPKRFRNMDKILRHQSPPSAYTSEQMISFEDIEKIVQAENNLLWKTYWLVLFYGGFRPSEASRLKWDQVFFEPEGVIIKIRTTKTNRDFLKSLPKEAEQLLKELKQQSNSELIFPSPIKKDTPILARSICQRLKRVSLKALGKEVTPYILRHSIATIMYNDDSRKDDDVASQLGHNKSMKQTYSHLNHEQIKTRARKLWAQTKPLTKDEREEFQRMKEDMKEMLEQMRVVREVLKLDIEEKLKPKKFKK